MNVDLVLERLAKVRKTGPGRWQSRCPAHEDRSPSLGIRECDDGRILVNCLAGCAVDDVLAAIDLETSDLFPERPPTGHYVRRQRRLWHASEVLTAVAFEILVAWQYSKQLAAGQPLNDADQARLFLCATRLQHALGAIHE